MELLPVALEIHGSPDFLDAICQNRLHSVLRTDGDLCLQWSELPHSAPYIRSIMALANSDVATSVASSIKRAKS